MVKAAKELPYPYYTGVVQSKDSFYGEVEPESMPLADNLKRRWKAWTDGNALASEMECASLFIISVYRKIRAGGIMNLIGGDGDMKQEGMNRMIKLGIEAVKVLIEEDGRKEKEQIAIS